MKKSPAVVDIIGELIDAVLVIFAIILIQIAFAGLADIIASVFDDTFTNLLITIPNFNYSIDNGMESGNTTFDIYSQLRFLAIIILSILIIIAVLIRFLNSAELTQNKIGNDLIRKAVLILIFIMIFPFIWDQMVTAMNIGTMWVLNPNYTQDKDSPCPDDWSDEDIMSRYNESSYDKDGRANVAILDLGKASIVCEPRFKIHYLVEQVTGSTSYELPEVSNPLDWVTSEISNVFKSAISSVFLGTLQALIAINVFIMALIIGVMADLFTGMVIAALPLLLAMTLIPQCKKMADMLLTTLPSLYLIPLMSAIVINIGSGFVASTGELDFANKSILGIPMGILYAWLSSLGVLFFSISIPIVMVPILSSVTSSATQIVTAATQAAAMVTASSVMGGVSAAKGNRASGAVKGLVTGHAGGSKGGGDSKEESEEEGEES